jgi:hypothetical protein
MSFRRLAIGVSATDQNDKTYKNAVRGKSVRTAARDVEILAPAPAGRLSAHHRHLGRGAHISASS